MTVALLDRHTDNDPLNKTDPLGLRPTDHGPPFVDCGGLEHYEPDGTVVCGVSIRNPSAPDDDDVFCAIEEYIDPWFPCDPEDPGFDCDIRFGKNAFKSRCRYFVTRSDTRLTAFYFARPEATVEGWVGQACSLPSGDRIRKALDRASVLIGDRDCYSFLRYFVLGDVRREAASAVGNEGCLTITFTAAFSDWQRRVPHLPNVVAFWGHAQPAESRCRP